MCSCWNPNQPAQEDLLLRARQRSWVCPFLPIFSTPSVWGRGSWRSRTKPCLYFRGCAGLGLCNIFVPLLWSSLPFSCEREPHTGVSAAFGSRRDFCPQLQNSVWQTAWFVPDFTCRTHLHNCDDCGCLLSFEPLGCRYIYCRYMCYCRERCAILKMQILGTSGKFSSKLIAHQM